MCVITTKSLIATIVLHMYYMLICININNTTHNCSAVPVKTSRHDLGTVITGVIAESTSKRPLASTRIELISLPDSRVASITSANKYGHYTFHDINSGDYILRFKLIGYRSSDIMLHIDKDDSIVSLGTTYLFPPILQIKKYGPLAWTNMTFDEMHAVISNHYNEANIDSSLWSDTIVPGPLYGKVVDYNNKQPLVNAIISLIDSMGNPCIYSDKYLASMTDSAGYFVIINVPRGQYAISVVKEGCSVQIPSYMWQVPGGAKIIGFILYVIIDDSVGLCCYLNINEII